MFWGSEVYTNSGALCDKKEYKITNFKIRYESQYL